MNNVVVSKNTSPHLSTQLSALFSVVTVSRTHVCVIHESVSSVQVFGTSCKIKHLVSSHKRLTHGCLHVPELPREFALMCMENTAVDTSGPSGQYLLNAAMLMCPENIGLIIHLSPLT